MSRNPIHRKRRCWLIWTPIAAVGAAIYVYSLGLTLTVNGLSILGLIVLFAGGVTALYETRQR